MKLWNPLIFSMVNPKSLDGKKKNKALEKALRAIMHIDRSSDVKKKKILGRNVVLPCLLRASATSIAGHDTTWHSPSAPHHLPPNTDLPLV